MEKIINKAIEGGYERREKTIHNQIGYYMCIPLDPLFWQALEKSCGWEHYGVEGKEYLDFALRFHEINLTQGFDSAVAWLSDLVDKK